MPAPLVARWLSWSIEPPRAGALGSVRAEMENAGAVAWGEDIVASYHWLDERDNAIVWDGLRTALPGDVAPGDRVALELRVRAPMPPGPYRLELDLVAEHRAWFAELGASGPTEAIAVLPRVSADRLDEVGVHHLPPSMARSDDWEQRAIRLHAEGYAVVAGAVAPPRRLRRALSAWAPGAGRVPGFAHALVCPSVLHGVELERLPDVAGLPAFRPPDGEPWVYDASLVLTLG